MRKRYQTGKTSSLKAKIKATEADLDVTSIMLAREQAKYEVGRGYFLGESIVSMKVLGAIILLSNIII